MTSTPPPPNGFHADDEALDDTRILGYEPLFAPQMVQYEAPLSAKSRQTVLQGRREASRILRGTDDRILVVVGPCSIHDVSAGIEYAKLLKSAAETYKDTLCLVMRSYFEKPRTVVGWKGLINDPAMDKSYKINAGLRIARKFLCDVTELGVPVGCELLDTISPQYFNDAVSWGAIGARTTECQLHRELASGVSFPVGFKNGTDGNVNIALDAMQASSHSHHFLSVTKQGLTSIVHTAGNDTCHIILRGSNKGPNYEKKYVDEVIEQLVARGEKPRVMVDASHGNSNKNHKNQILVVQEIARQVAEGSSGVFGVMVESNLNEGNQKIPEGGAKDLKYGVSITDACVNWETTQEMFSILSEAVKTRRRIVGGK